MSIAQDIAQFCENGHVVNSFAVWASSQNEDFCPTCGAKTQTKCTNCNTPIQGGVRHLGLTQPGEKEPRTMFREDVATIPFHCSKCGLAFPWAKKQAASVTSEEKTKTKSFFQKITDNKLVNTIVGSVVSEATKATLPPK
jgi:hypothetical protein